MRRKLKAMLAGLALLIAGCASPTKDDVTQERNFFEVVAPRFATYSAKDDTLSPAKRQDDIDFLQAYDSWLSDREKRAGVTK